MILGIDVSTSITGFAIIDNKGKIVKISPTSYDDIVLDMVWGSVKKMLGKK